MGFATGIAKKYEPIIAAIMGVVRRTEPFLGPGDNWVEEDRRHLYEAKNGDFIEVDTETSDDIKERYAQKILDSDKTGV